jgi:hypothetical protein
VADINDRLERLSRRDELARRARERAVPPAAIAGVGADFIEVVEAVAQVVRRHPGMSVMIAPGDGRRRSAVIRVTERSGSAEIAPVTMAVSGDGHFGPPGADHQSLYAQAEPAPPPELSYPDLVRPDFTTLPPEHGYPDQPPPMPAQPAWRPPPPEPVPQQPAPYEAAPADTWVWER